MKWKILKWAPAFTALVSLVVYLITMSRGLLPIDAGELAASQCTLGVSHPSGYPLFNLLGFLWSKLPIGTVIFRLNLLSAILVASSQFFVAGILVQYARFFSAPPVAGKTTTPVVEISWQQMLGACTAALMLGFGLTYWSQSAGVEVYALHVALVTAFLYAFTPVVLSGSFSLRTAVTSGIVLGMGMGNHLTTVLLLPAILLMVVRLFVLHKSIKKIGVPLAVMAISALAVSAGLYAFMMVRSGSHPVLNWGDPSNMEYLQRHVSGWQFHAFFNNGKGKTGSERFFEELASEVSIPGILLTLLGMVFMFRKHVWAGVFWTVQIVAVLYYISRYRIPDIQNYYLMAFIGMSIFTGVALLSLLPLRMLSKTPSLAWFMLLFPAILLWMNFDASNKSKQTYVDDYALAALQSVDQNAIILSREWDVFVSPCLYYQHVLHIRPDVLVVDKELMRRSWYFGQIQTWNSEVAAYCKAEAEAFNKAVLPFERKQKFNPQEIQARFEAYILKLLSLYTSRPVYISSLIYDADVSKGIDVPLPAGSEIIPETYFWRVLPLDTTRYHALPVQPRVDLDISVSKENNLYQQQVLAFTINILTMRLSYEMAMGKKEEAVRLQQLIKQLNPAMEPVPGLN